MGSGAVSQGSFFYLSSFSNTIISSAYAKGESCEALSLLADGRVNPAKFSYCWPQRQV